MQSIARQKLISLCHFVQSCKANQIKVLLVTYCNTLTAITAPELQAQYPLKGGVQVKTTTNMSCIRSLLLLCMLGATLAATVTKTGKRIQDTVFLQATNTCQACNLPNKHYTMQRKLTTIGEDFLTVFSSVLCLW